MKFFAIIFLVLLGGCSSNAAKETNQEKEIEVHTIQKEFTPQVWSGHKTLTIPVEKCAEKGVAILESLGFNQVVKNGNYVYGNYSNNRAAIKCVAVDKNTFVYAAVAGTQVKIVEKLRNEIVWQL